MVGVQKVTNPLPSEGGADPEPPGTARANAPRSVRTLGRAVSLRDLEDLVTESGLIAKSQATWAWDGFDRAIHLTVAAQLGAPLGAQQLSEMVASLNLARDINRKLTAADYAPVPVQLAANVTVDPRAEDPAAVVTAVRTAALMALSFDAVSLGRPLHVSDVIAVLASVPLVLGVDVDLFGFLPTSAMTPAELDRRGVTRRADGSVAPVQGNLRFFPARPGGGPGRTHPAELPVIVNASRDVVVIEGPPA